MSKTMYATYRDQRADSYKFKLTYFNGRGRAEAIRYVFAAAGKKYEDCRIGEEWAAMKPNTPFGSLPVLEVDGQMIGSSIAIGRFVAKICDMAGSNFLEQARVDSIVDTSIDLREAAVKAITEAGKMEQQADKEKTLGEMAEKVAPALACLSKLLGENDYFVENKLSYADLQFYASVEVVFELGGLSNFLDKHENLKKLNKRISELPKIAEYKKNRPQTSF